MFLLMIPLILSVALSLPLSMRPRTVGMIPRPLYRTPVKVSRASYVQSINSNTSYHAMFEVSSDIPVFHLINLPGIENVYCDGQSVSVETKFPELLQEWSELKQLMLIMDFYECPMQEQPFHVSNSWTVVGNTINFQIEPASNANVEASINVLIHPIFNEISVFDVIHDQGIDNYIAKVRGHTDDKTFTYPYNFNFDSDKTWNIGTTGGFIKCDTCNITGEIDLVLNIKGTLQSDYSIEAFISGNILGSLNLAAGLKKQVTDEKTILYQIDFPTFELPGMLEAHPSFSVYSLSTLSGNEQVSFNSKVLSTAKDFHVSLFSVNGSHGKFKFEGTDKFEISSLHDNERKIPQNRFSLTSLDYISGFMKRSRTGNKFVNSDVSIVADFKVGYKMMGSPKSELNVGVSSSVSGLYGLLDPKDRCRHHLSGDINAHSLLFADLGAVKHVLKETPSVPVWKGCFGRAKY